MFTIIITTGAGAAFTHGTIPGITVDGMVGTPHGTTSATPHGTTVVGTPHGTTVVGTAGTFPGTIDLATMATGMTPGTTVQGFFPTVVGMTHITGTGSAVPITTVIVMVTTVA